MITREKLIKSPGYWKAEIQLSLFNEVHDYMEKHQMNQSQLAEHLGVSKSYVSQMLNCETDHRVSKLVQIALSIGKVPSIVWEDIEEFIKENEKGAVIPIQKRPIQVTFSNAPETLHSDQYGVNEYANSQFC